MVISAARNEDKEQEKIQWLFRKQYRHQDYIVPCPLARLSLRTEDSKEDVHQGLGQLWPTNSDKQSAVDRYLRKRLHSPDRQTSNCKFT